MTGFCLVSEMTPSQKKYILENDRDATIVRLASVGVRGTKHYTTAELLGYPVKGMVYLVTDNNRFEREIAAKLEGDFLKKNPRRRGNIRGAFTRFMHENKLHWSMCCKQRRMC